MTNRKHPKGEMKTTIGTLSQIEIFTDIRLKENKMKNSAVIAGVNLSGTKQTNSKGESLELTRLKTVLVLESWVVGWGVG